MAMDATAGAARPIRLGVVAGSMSRRAGGLFNSVRMGAIHLAAAGAEVRVFAGEDGDSAADLPHWAPVPVRLFRPIWPAALGHLPGLRQALDDAALDIVHLHGIWLASSRDVWRWKQRTGRPVMISPRGMLDPWALANARWKKRLAGALFEHRNLADADCLHALNESEAQSMRSFGLRNPIAIIPNGTSLPDEVASLAPPAVGERRTLLFLGRLHPKKGLAELIEAWALLNRHHPALASGWRLVIAGWDDGGHLDGLRQSARACQLGAETLHFAGPAYGEAKDRLLRDAHAFILPSFSEGLPMSVLEAWAHGLPVLMTEQCNLPAGFASGAALPISTEPSALAGELGLALARADLRQIGRNGKVLVEKHFAWPSIAALHIEIYRWLMVGGERPKCVLQD